MQNNWWIYIVLIGLMAVMLILPMITNRKRSKDYNNMLDSIRVGDTIRTIGGIIGRITKINEKDGYKTIIIETGAKNAKTTMELDFASIYSVVNQSKAAEPKKEENKEASQNAEAKVEEKVEDKAAEAEKVETTAAKEEPKTKKKTTKAKKSK